MNEDEMLDRVLYRDGMLLVFDKPAGIAVHMGPGKGDNLERYFDYLRYGLPRPPALVHRLDRDTSGCLVLGRHRKALARAGRLFSEGRAEKVYWAICAGVPEGKTGTIDAALRKKNDRVAGWEMQVVAPGTADSQTAVTDWKLLSQSERYSLIEFRPKTGRTHQIRVHAEHLGVPLIGDPRYVSKLSEADRKLPLCLHALSITLPYYQNKPAISVAAPLPAQFRMRLAAFDLIPDIAVADAP